MGAGWHLARGAGQTAGAHPTGTVIVGLIIVWLAGAGWWALGIGAALAVAPWLSVVAEAWWDAQGLGTQLGVLTAGAVLVAAAVTVGVWLAGVLVVALVGLALRRWVRGRPWRDHYREHVEPLHDALAPVLGYPPELSPTRYLDVPVGLLDEGEGGITVTLPRGALPSEHQRGQILETVATVLDLAHYKVDWRLAGASRHLHISAAAPPPQVPAQVRYREVLDAIESAAPEAPLLAVTLHDRTVGVDLAAETPHILLSCQTGWGKSSTVGLAVAHVLHHGGDVVIPDIKVFSMRWAEGLPGVTYCPSIASIHDVLVRVGRLIAKRNQQARELPWDVKPSFPRLLVVLEELNACQDELRRHWSRVREKGDDKESPAIAAYKQMLLMGRAVSVNCIAITQSGTAQATGGPAQREQYGTRILGWYTQNAWNMLIPQHPYVKATNRRGHGWLAQGSQARECQFIYATDAELRTRATSGQEPARALSQVSQGDDTSSTQDGPLGHVSGPPHLAVVADDSGPVTLRAASSDKGDDGGIVAERRTALRKASSRDPSFPAPVGRSDDGSAFTYDRDALIAWSTNRQARRLREEPSA